MEWRITDVYGLTWTLIENEETAKKYCEQILHSTKVLDMTLTKHNNHTYEWITTEANSLDWDMGKTISYFVDGFCVAQYMFDIEDNDDSTVHIEVYKPYSRDVQYKFTVRNEVKARSYIESTVRPWE